MKTKLDVVMKLDEHCRDKGMYSIKSLYFDNVYDKALNEKLHGVNKREKFRIRYYDNDTDFMRLEKKQKVDGLCLKTSSVISKDAVEKLISGDYSFLKESEDNLYRELAFKMDTQGLRPRNIVKYDRRAYVYEPGNVRVTFDMNLQSGINIQNFMKNSCNQFVEASEKDLIIMEVKYDEFIPSLVENLLIGIQGRVQAFSKYAQCRKII